MADFVEEVGKLVSERLGTVVNAMWSKENTREVVQKQRELYKRYLKPGNVHLNCIAVNEELYMKMPKNARNRNLRLRGVQTGVMRTIFPLIRVVDTLINKVPGATEMQGLVDHLMDSLQMSAVANGLLNQIRRERLRSFLNPRFAAYLCAVRPPVESDLCLVTMLVTPSIQ